MSDGTYNPSRRIAGLTPPHNDQAEQSVLGSSLYGDEYLAAIVSTLKVDDFYNPAHRLIFESIVRLFTANKPVDILTVSDDLASRGLLEQAGGAGYIARLPDLTPILANHKHYTKIVLEKSMLRRLILTFDDLIGHCFEEKDEADNLANLAAKRVFDIRENRGAAGFERIGPMLSRKINELSDPNREHERPPIRSGYHCIDHTLGGLKRGALIILAARPAMGKTALALNIAQKTASIFGTATAIFSLEMSKEEVLNRILSAQTGVPGRRIADNKVTDEDLEKMAKTYGTLLAAPLYIDDQSNITVVEMLARCRQLKFEVDLGLVVVDYLQLMGSAGTGRRSENRQQEISDISRSLKIMARELDVPVLALSQLSRASEKRKERTPVLSDLRDSGAIEQDADAVLFIHREQYYNTNKDVESPVENVQLIVAKNRHGATADLKLIWHREITSFSEDARDQTPPPY